MFIFFITGCESHWDNFPWEEDFLIQGKIILDEKSWKIIFKLNSKEYYYGVPTNEFVFVSNDIKNNDIIIIKFHRVNNHSHRTEVCVNEFYYEIFCYFRKELITNFKIFSDTKEFYRIYQYDRIKFSNKYRKRHLDKQGEKYFLGFNYLINNSNICEKCNKIIQNNDNCELTKEINYQQLLIDDAKKDNIYEK